MKLLSVLVWHSLLFGNVVEGRSLQDMEYEMKGSIQNLSISHGNSFDRRASERDLFTKEEYNKDISDNYINTDEVNPNADPNYVTHRATFQSKDGLYHGIYAQLSVHTIPNVQSIQSSGAAIWVVSTIGDSSKFDGIQAGWHVNPNLYKDNETHFFIRSTIDGYQSTQWYNLRCPYFVLDKASPIKPGDILKQPAITLKFSLDWAGSWWLHMDETRGLLPIGYWTSGPDHFSKLAKGATQFELGGTVGYPKNQRGPAMGSGDFPEDPHGQAAFIEWVEFVDEKGGLYKPNDGDFHPFQNRAACYNVSELLKASDKSSMFSYGGPAGCVN